jgi:glycine cleavage system H lipoate-binding protein
MPGEDKQSEAIEPTLTTINKSLIAAPKNINQITEEEYDAWIQKVTDSIAGRILLRKVDRPEPESGSRGGEQWN